LNQPPPLRAAVTTVVRGATLRESSGWLRVVDLTARQVQGSFPLPESRRRLRDPNPRGGLRGGKGLSSHAGRFVVANTDTLFVLDSDWQVAKRITHPWLGGVHAILAEADGIWVTCTSADLLLKLSWDGKLLDHWLWRDDRELRRQLGASQGGSQFDPARDYRDPLASGGSFNVSHLNAVARAPEGLVVGLGRLLSPRALRRQRVEGAMVRLAEKTAPSRSALRAVRRRREVRGSWTPGGKRRVDSAHALVAVDGRAAAGGRLAGTGTVARLLLHIRGIAVPNHDVTVDGDRLLYNDSNRDRLVAVDRGTGRETASVPIPGRPGFARGLARLSRDRFLVGSKCPAAIHIADLAAGTVVDSIALGEAGRDSVFAIAMLPPQFGPVPDSLDALAEPLP
jgi:hypothetical protein